MAEETPTPGAAPIADPAAPTVPDPSHVADPTPSPSEPVVTEPTPTPAPTPGGDPDPDSPVHPETPKWIKERLGRYARKTQQLEQDNAAKDATIQALTARLTSPPGATPTAEPGASPPPPPPPPAAAPKPTLTEADVQAAAQALVAKQTFDQACNDVFAAGTKDIPNFAQAVENLQLAGVVESQPFLEAVIAQPEAHKLLAHLGKNVEEAQRIVALPPIRMASELTRLGLDVSKPPKPVVSKAPAPITPIAGTSGGSSTELTDELSDAEWIRRREVQLERKRKG